MRFRSISQIIGLVALSGLLYACASTEDKPKSTEPVSYETSTVPTLVMLQPSGTFVRVSSAWMGPIASLPSLPEDCFGSILADPASPGPHCVLWIPKALAEEAAKHPADSVITVEGETFKKNGQVGIRVHRFK